MAIYLDGLALDDIGKNMRIEVTVHAESTALRGPGGERLREDVTAVFYTLADPQYCTIDHVALAGGEMIEHLPDAAIHLMAHANSVAIDHQLLFDPAERFPDDTARDWLYFSHARMEYVRLKTLLDLTRAILSSRGAGASRKILADFTVDTSTIANFLAQLREFLADLAREAEAWKAVVFSGGKADANSPLGLAAVRGAGHPTPYSLGISRRWESGASTVHRQDPGTAGPSGFSRPPKY